MKIQRLRLGISLLCFLSLASGMYCQSGTEGAETASDKGSEAEPITLTVDEAVAYAMEHSRTLKSAQIDLEIARRAKQFAWNSFIPTVSAGAGISRSNEVSTISIPGLPIQTPEPEEKDHWAFSGSVGVSLNLSLALIDGIRAIKANYEAGLITWEQALKQNELNVRKLFYALLLQQENLRIQEESLTNAENRAEQARVNYRNGRIPELEYLQARVTYENLKPKVLSSRLLLRQQLDMFAFVLGMPVGTKISLSGEIEPAFLELDVDELIAAYLPQNINIRLTQKKLELLRINLGAQRFQIFSPTLSLGWGYQPSISPLDADWVRDVNDRGAFSATLAWNISDMLPFSSNFQKMKDTEAQITQLEINLEDLMANTELDIRTKADALDSYRAAIEANAANIVLAQRSYDMTLEAYRNGTRELLDVRDAENQLNTAKLGLINEKYNYMAGVLDLEYALNTTLSAAAE